MAQIALDLSQFKSAGVYTVEVDQTARVQITTQTLRMLPGFSAVGPFNAPVFIRSTKDLQRFYGPIDVKLERKGSFFHRSIQTALLTAPVFAINLLKADEAPDTSTHTNYDKVGFVPLSLDASTQNSPASKDLFVHFFNRERFWKPDQEYLQGVANNSVGATSDEDGPLFSVVNIGTKNLSFIIRKATGLSKFGVTALDWYGSETNIPFEWIRPYDLISDYFVQVIAVEGDWSNYQQLAADPYYSKFFDFNMLSLVHPSSSSW